MTYSNVQNCVSFVSANRLIAENFTAKVSQLNGLLQSVEDIEERVRIADLIEFSEKRSRVHDSLAALQERDLGIKCHCSAINSLQKDLATAQILLTPTLN